MKRSEIINQLLNEGFTSNTLMNFSDKQLLSLSKRINESLTVSEKDLASNPNLKNKATDMAKTSDVKLVPEGGVPGLKAKKVVKETGVPGLAAKKTGSDLKHGTSEKEMKEGGVPGLKAKKEVKETGVPGLTAKKTGSDLKHGTSEKEMKESGVPGLTAKKTGSDLKHGTSEKEMKEGGVPGLTAKKEVKEAAGAMPGLTVGGGNKNTTKQSTKPVKETEVEENDDNDADDKQEGKVSKKQAFLDMIKKKKENKSINEWVDDVAQKHYRPFTTKNDIMEMIMTKLEEIEMEESKGEKLPEFLKYKSIKGSGAAPAPAEPKTKPGTKTPPKQNPNERPKTPYRPPFPRENPHPKAKMGLKVTPKSNPKA